MAVRKPRGGNWQQDAQTTLNMQIRAQKYAEDPARSHPVDFQLVLPKSIQRIPREKEKQNKLGEEMMEFCSRPDTLVLAEFAISKMIPPPELTALAKTNPYFNLCFEIARAMIATRLQKGALTGTLDAGAVFKLLPLYYKEYKDDITERIKATIAKGQESNQPFNVQIQQFPKTALVPEKI